MKLGSTRRPRASSRTIDTDIPALTRRTTVNESAQAGAEVLAMGFILLVGMVLLAMNAWAVIDAKIRTAGAARFAVRVLVETDTDGLFDSIGTWEIDSPASNVATRAVRTAMSDRPHLLRNVRVSVAIPAGALRCSRAELSVRVNVPAFGFPHVGPLRNGFEVESHQSEIIDPFRSGLDGSGDCA